MTTHWSFSSLQKIMQCPRSWFTKYVQGREPPPSSAASFGSQFDKAVAKQLGLIKGEETFLPEVSDAVSYYLCQPQAWTEADEAQKKIDISPTEWALYGEMCGVPAQTHRPIIGYLDLVRTRNFQTEVLDLKTSTRKDLNPEWLLQTLLYSLPLRATVVRIHLLVRYKAGPGFFPFQLAVTPRAQAWAISTLNYYIQRGEELIKEECIDALPAKPGYWCDWCADNIQCEGAFVALMGGKKE